MLRVAIVLGISATVSLPNGVPRVETVLAGATFRDCGPYQSIAFVDHDSVHLIEGREGNRIFSRTAEYHLRGGTSLLIDGSHEFELGSKKDLRLAGARFGRMFECVPDRG